MKNIDIQTTQNVTIEYELATLMDRFIAMLIDCMIFYFCYIMLVMVVLSFVGIGLGDGSSEFVMAILGFFPLMGFMGYHLISEITANGQSFGKKAMGIKVVRLDGEEASLSDFLLRAIFHLVDTFFTLGILAALLISSSQRKQRLGDMTSNTTVIKVKAHSQFQLADILKINTIQDYVPIYEDIKHFNEADMLLVKTIISRYRKHPNQAHREALLGAVKRFSELLELPEIPKKKIEFLETLLKDYVVLTR